MDISSIILTATAVMARMRPAASWRPICGSSLTVGMKQQDFLSIAMAGKKEQGMPSWAGFLTEDDVVHIYRYVKGRSLDLVPPAGRRPGKTATIKGDLK